MYVNSKCVKNKNNEVTSQGTLTLVDLAGSERLDQTLNQGNERMKETMSINKSLTSLGDVVTAISRKDKFVPYRNSKLTYLLQNYLGKDSKTLMIVSLNPCMYSFNQTINSLKFASKVKNCESAVVRQNVQERGGYQDRQGYGGGHQQGGFNKNRGGFGQGNFRGDNNRF